MLRRTLLVLGILFLLFVAVSTTVFRETYKDSYANTICYEPYPELMAGGAQYLSGGTPPTRCTLILEKADTPEKRTQGLSGRKNITANIGMLFIFDNPGRHCMWMKDMSFNIDMVWLNESKAIIHIEKNVSPDTFPAAFCGEQPAKYVLEVKAGVADATGFKEGLRLNL